MKTELKTILARRTIPADFTIVYDDRHGLWGGRTITVRGDGTLERRTMPMGVAEAEVVQTQVDEPELLALIQLLAELQAWQQQTPESRPIAGESRAHLTIRVNGRSSHIWERFNEMAANGSLVHIKTRLENL